MVIVNIMNGDLNDDEPFLNHVFAYKQAEPGAVTDGVRTYVNMAEELCLL